MLVRNFFSNTVNVHSHGTPIISSYRHKNLSLTYTLHQTVTPHTPHFCKTQFITLPSLPRFSYCTIYTHFSASFIYRNKFTKLQARTLSATSCRVPYAFEHREALRSPHKMNPFIKYKDGDNIRNVVGYVRLFHCAPPKESILTIIKNV